MIARIQKASEQPFDIRRSRRIGRHVDIVKVVRQYVRLAKLGPLYIGKCPLSRHRTKATKKLFVVSPEQREFYCFGCGHDGGAISFLMMTAGLTFIDAVRHLEKNFLSTRSTMSLRSRPSTGDS